MGIWQALKLFLSYGNYANLGISKGAVREYTVARGQGNTTDARRGLNLAFTVNTLSSVVYGLILVAAGIAVGLRGGGTWSVSWGLGLAVIGVAAVVSRYVTFHVTILRAGQAFALTSRLAVIEALLTLAACGTAVWCWGLPGLYFGTLVVLVGTLLFVRRHRAVTLAWAMEWPGIRRLVAIGAPILLAGTVSSLLRSLDKLMILGYLSDREFQLGCYSVTLMVTAQLFGLGNMFSMVIGPRLGEKFGQLHNRREVARLAARASELQAIAISLPAALSLTVAAPLLIWLLPDYQTGLAALPWLIPGVVALTLALPASQYLVAVDRQRRALAVVAVATLLAAGGNHLALSGGFGLVGVAIATAIAYIVYLALVVGVSLWVELDGRERIRYLAMVTLAVIPTLGLAAGPRPGRTHDEKKGSELFF
jgi:O-antigen/teichoic acid export membrane protein